MPIFTLIDTVARREDKFPLGCEIVLDIARKVGWYADKTITDNGNAQKIGGLEKDHNNALNCSTSYTNGTMALRGRESRELGKRSKDISFGPIHWC